VRPGSNNEPASDQHSKDRILVPRLSVCPATVDHYRVRNTRRSAYIDAQKAQREDDVMTNMMKIEVRLQQKSCHAIARHALTLF